MRKIEFWTGVRFVQCPKAMAEPESLVVLATQGELLVEKLDAITLVD
jgi:hypothetical protein